MTFYEEFLVGEEVVLDKDESTSTIVVIISQSSPSRILTKVRHPKNDITWDVRTTRLTKLV